MSKNAKHQEAAIAPLFVLPAFELDLPADFQLAIERVQIETKRVNGAYAKAMELAADVKQLEHEAAELRDKISSVGDVSAAARALGLDAGAPPESQTNIPVLRERVAAIERDLEEKRRALSAAPAVYDAARDALERALTNADECFTLALEPLRYWITLGYATIQQMHAALSAAKDMVEARGSTNFRIAQGVEFPAGSPLRATQPLAEIRAHIEAARAANRPLPSAKPIIVQKTPAELDAEREAHYAEITRQNHENAAQWEKDQEARDREQLAEGRGRSWASLGYGA